MKIAAVTASGFESQRSEVLAAGLDDYVRKPYRPERSSIVWSVIWVFAIAVRTRRPNVARMGRRHSQRIRSHNFLPHCA